jgi:hypothetical protein
MAMLRCCHGEETSSIQSMWYPTKETLRMKGLIFRVSFAATLAVPVGPGDGP